MKLRQLFGNQWRVIRPIGLVCKTFIKSYLKAGLNDFRHLFYNLKYSCIEKFGNKPILVTDELKKELSHSKHDQHHIKITFYGAARRKGNYCCHLDEFLQSLLEKTKDLSCIEVLLAIDPDDHLHYFLELKKKYESFFQFKIFISEKRLGYEKLHCYDTILFKEIASTTKMLCDFSDDCYLILNHFDQALLEIDSKHPDNIYFIHTKMTDREAYLGNLSEHVALLYWIMQTKSPASYFPIISRKILDIANRYADTHDTNKEWSPLANSWICDCYIDILATYVKRLGLDRIHSLAMIEMDAYNVSAFHYVDKKHALTPNHIAFIKMLRSDSLDYLSGLASAIAHHANQN